MAFHLTSSFEPVVLSCGKHLNKYVMVYHIFISFEMHYQWLAITNELVDFRKSPECKIDHDNDCYLAEEQNYLQKQKRGAKGPTSVTNMGANSFLYKNVCR